MFGEAHALGSLVVTVSTVWSISVSIIIFCVTDIRMTADRCRPFASSRSDRSLVKKAACVTSCCSSFCCLSNSAEPRIWTYQNNGSSANDCDFSGLPPGAVNVSLEHMPAAYVRRRLKSSDDNDDRIFRQERRRRIGTF